MGRKAGGTNMPKGTITFTDKVAIDFNELKKKVDEQDAAGNNK